MKFKPQYKLDLIKESEYNEKMQEITELFDKCSNKGFLESFDGTKLNYEYFLCENATASVIIVHGFTEFIKKFYEMAYYFLNMGYNVFLYDQRGHGYSDRKVENTELTHVDDFEDYVCDLECFVDRVVSPASEGKPIYMFAHSMGGSVATLYLTRCGDKIAKTVLSAPMVEPCAHNIPRFVLNHYIKSCAKKESWDSDFPHFGKFDPNASFEKSSDSSYNRFKSNLDMRINDLNYRNSTSTYSWMYQSINICDRILVRKKLKQIKSKVLMFSAGRDTVVKIRPQLKLARRIPGCVLERVPEAKHSIYTGEPETLLNFYNKTFAFLAEN
ncbi:MAG: alpha/beta hydrolase [Clostridia bacterium]|nr:alpha/beta hydrolase [Clostridia bacterium]